MSSLPDPHTIEAFFATPCYDAPKRGIGGVVKTGAWDLPPAPKWNAPPSLVTGDVPTTGFDSSQTSWSSDDPPDLPQWGDSVANEWIRPVAEPTRETVDIWDFLEKYENQYQAERETRYIVGSPERPTLNQRRKNAMKNQSPSKNQKVSAMERVPDSDRLFYAPKRVYGEKKKDAWSDAVSFGRVFSEFQNAHTLVIGLFDDVDPLPIRYICDEIWESNDGDMVPDWFLRPYLLHPEWMKRHPIFPQPNPNPPPPPNQPPPPQAPHRHPDTPPQRSSTPTPRTSRPTRSADQLRRVSHRTRGSDTRGTRPRSRSTQRSYRPAGSTYRPKYTQGARSPRRSRSPRRGARNTSRTIYSRSPSPRRRISGRRSRSRSRTIPSRSGSSTPRVRRMSVPRVTRSPSSRARSPSPHTPPPRSPFNEPSPLSPTPSSSPLTPLSSLSDELPDSLPPTTPHEEGEPQFVHDDGLHAEDDALERIQPAAKEFGLGIAMSTMDDDIAPMVPHALVPEDVEMDNDTPQGEGLVVGGTLPHFDPFTEYLYFRFGFTHPSDGPPYKPLEAWGGSLSNEDFNSLVAMVHYRETAFADEHLRKALYHFVEPALARVDPPAGLWDLNYANPRFLNRNSVRVEVTDYTEMEGRPLYRLRSGPEDHDWILIVSDVLVAVECLRRELLLTHDIVYFFLRRGTPFTIAHVGSTSTLEDDSELIPTIPDGFQPDAAYFEQWETAVRDFLVSPRGHLVWRLGGLYWRIALYVLGTVPGHQDMIENDTGFITSKLRSGFYEEPLTPAELAIVIGLARVDDPNPNASLARMSYFPHPNTAEGTTLLSSVWTPLNEEWFVAHLLSIRHGGPGWRSQNAWRKLLRGATTAHPLTRRLEVFHRESATEWLKAW